MKTCVHCGSVIEDKCRFCPNCGAKCEDGQPAQGPAVQLPADSPQAESGAEAPAGSYPMRWHRFLMVMMVIGGVLTVANGLTAMTGSSYLIDGLEAEYIYSAFPGVKTCDQVYGVALIAIGVFEFIVRGRLRSFQRSGPLSMKVMYILSIAANLIYLAAASSVTSIRMISSSFRESAVFSLVLLVINSIYYGRRRDMFVN